MGAKRPRTVALGAVTAILAAAAPAGGETVLATPPNETAIKAYAGYTLYGAFDAPGAENYRLVVRHPDGTARTLPVAPRQDRFDADIGPDSSGRPQVIYTRCKRARRGSRTERPNCDLYVLSLARGSRRARPRPVRTANTPGASEEAPTVWKGRIAFARYYPGRELPVIYTKHLAGSRRSERVSGLPSRRDGRPTTDGDVHEAELYGRNLALNIGYDEREGEFEFRRREVRLSFLTGGARQIAAVGQGAGGQSWLGVSFADGRLGFVFSCLGDLGGCGRSSILRYSISGGTYAEGRAPVDPVVGHAVVDRARSIVQGRCWLNVGDPCPIVLTEPVRFQATSPPR